MPYASHALYARFCWKPLTHYHFNISYFPNIRRRIFVVCPHYCVLRQKTNLLVIRRHQSQNQGLGSAWSIGHAQNIRSLGRLGSNRSGPTFNVYASWCNNDMSSILIFSNILTYVMQHFCIINTQNFKTASTGSGK